MEERADCDRSFGDALREVRSRQEVCDHEWVELTGDDFELHRRNSDVMRDDVRLTAVGRCRKCAAFRYVALLLADRRR